VSYHTCELSSLDNSDKNLIIRASVLRSHYQLSLGSTEDPLLRDRRKLSHVTSLTTSSDLLSWLAFTKESLQGPLEEVKAVWVCPPGWTEGLILPLDLVRATFPFPPQQLVCLCHSPAPCWCSSSPPCEKMEPEGEYLKASYPWCHMGLRYKGSIWAARGLAPFTTATVLALQHSYRCRLFSATNENCFKAPCHPPVSLLRDSAYF